MNPESKSHWLITLGLAVGLMLVGFASYMQANAIKQQGKKIDVLIQDMFLQHCEDSGGIFANGTCSCPVDFQLDNGYCVGPDGSFGGVMGEAMRMRLEQKMKENAMMEPTGDNDAGPGIVCGDLGVWLPLDWNFQKEIEGRWKVTESETGVNRGTVYCPALETGYEVWDFTETKRSFTKNGKTWLVQKSIGSPSAGEETSGWIALIYVVPTTPSDVPSGLSILFYLSSPPTADELGRIDTIYEMIR